ncbi:alpha-L-fucosidase [Thalassotalea psychrophila]|uniref:alpha-L-fucosidase n=1 Tax=Thalassotalea psychrophila TaxID=3065647 RepID=A0ABY9TW79_9GAMM|nr:alpha-L-fucosidase [Colwelliaceae bacterium SQ149]
MNKKNISKAIYAALFSLPLISMSAQASQAEIGCTSEELAVHNAMSEGEKQKFYGFEGSGIPCSTEMKTLTNEWQELNSSAAKQRGRDRFRENKYGMFIHWGLYSTLGGVYQGEKMEDGGTGPSVAEWIMRRKEIPRSEYAKLANNFNPVKFDAEQWVDIAKAAGMKYIVITSKHHDGFALFDSKVNDFNVVKATPFKRDIIKELEQACKKAGLAFGVYYSNALDWRDGGDSGLKDYGPGPGIKPRRGAFVNKFDPSPVTFDEYIENKSLPQVKELLANYDLSQIWFDTPIYIPPKHSIDFYRTVYDANPEILINARIGNGFADIGTPGDNVIPDKASANTWEGIATTNHSWGYKSYDNDWKSPLETLYWLIANVSRGGNFLLNVGPMGSGEIPAQSVSNLVAVGDWLKVNGEAIYGTVPWTLDHEGPTQIIRKGKNKTGNFDFTNKDFWFTQKGDKVYVISLSRPAANNITVASLKGLGISSIRLLGQPDVITWQEGVEGIDIKLPTLTNKGIGYALEVSF